MGMQGKAGALERLKSGWEHARRRWWVRWGVDLVVLAVLLTAVAAWQARRLPGAGTPAPAFTLRTLAGETVSLDSLRGKPVVLAFWAPWCGVCGMESSNISRLRSLAGDSAHVVSVALAYDDEEAVRRFVAKHGVDYPVLLGDDGVQQDWRVDTFPTVVFLSPEGRVERAVVGYTTLAGLSWRLLL
ncbi:TlpA family protein disulfide reductase [Pyxidicoccus fallax]|uniref:TlpA family protein disulfide reductase n=1 Tax=Pyxidicoccus fallax TaxID=394095 RepID=A0A848L4A3_9BACT|nr:TlpA disulfide reductase family protein [Pyxidicoccus fallax]NMO13287.1 TlpA family protein disulfide reductase [Pyxidicoccus fallax]NPC77193.1 TlpA family protein disulfide reductase [Pyxidicoccus fallax]